MDIIVRTAILSTLLGFAAVATAAPPAVRSEDNALLHIAQASIPMTAGEIRKVDKDARKLTIKHEAIKNVDMPAMTMAFQVKDPSMLDRVKVGDKVMFNVEQVGGAMVVTKIEPAK